MASSGINIKFQNGFLPSCTNIVSFLNLFIFVVGQFRLCGSLLLRLVHFHCFTIRNFIEVSLVCDKIGKSQSFLLSKSSSNDLYYVSLVRYPVKGLYILIIHLDVPNHFES